MKYFVIALFVGLFSSFGNGQSLDDNSTKKMAASKAILAEELLKGTIDGTNWKFESGNAFGFEGQELKIQLLSSTLENIKPCDRQEVYDEIKINISIPFEKGSHDDTQINLNYLSSDGKYNWLSHVKGDIDIMKVGDFIYGSLKINHASVDLEGDFSVPLCSVSEDANLEQSLAGNIGEEKWIFKQGYVKKKMFGNGVEINLGNKKSDKACKWYYIGQVLTIELNDLKVGPMDIFSVMLHSAETEGSQTLTTGKGEILSLENGVLKGKVSFLDANTNLTGTFEIPICEE